MGLINSYSKCIPCFACLVFPLIELLGKGKPMMVAWNSECEDAIRKIQTLLSQRLLLLFAGLDIPFILQTAASDKGISCCLMQKVKDILRPVRYLSRELLPREQRMLLSYVVYNVWRSTFAALISQFNVIIFHWHF